MSATPISRRVVREAIAAGLAANVPSAQAVYGYAKADFAGQSPIVRVMSTSVQRPQLAQQGIRSMMMFTVDVWVLLSNEAGWSEQDAENTLDAVEHEIVNWVTANQNNGTWTSLLYDRQTDIQPVVVAGEPWLVEEITLRAEVYG